MLPTSLTLRGRAALILRLHDASSARRWQPYSLAPICSIAADYVGSNVCRTCHPDIWSTVLPQSTLQEHRLRQGTPENTGCESCHGPGQGPRRSPGGKATIHRVLANWAPRRFSTPACVATSQTLSRANIRRSAHTQEDVVCTNCHSIHKSQAPKFLLANKQTELCYSCHATVRAQFSMPFKHRVNEGTIQCTDCHNPTAPSPHLAHGGSVPT